MTHSVHVIYSYMEQTRLNNYYLFKQDNTIYNIFQVVETDNFIEKLITVLLNLIKYRVFFNRVCFNLV